MTATRGRSGHAVVARDDHRSRRRRGHLDRQRPARAPLEPVRHHHGRSLAVVEHRSRGHRRLHHLLPAQDGWRKSGGPRVHHYPELGSQDHRRRRLHLLRGAPRGRRRGLRRHRRDHADRGRTRRARRRHRPRAQRLHHRRGQRAQPRQARVRWRRRLLLHPRSGLRRCGHVHVRRRRLSQRVPSGPGDHHGAQHAGRAIGADDLYEATEDTALVVDAKSGVLANDLDADDDVLEAVLVDARSPAA